ncbi:MAG: hypothetical protein QOF81_838, partial [Acidimicrobiaceae bacterium]|nr:hypothetical protein [Acidimicrobiaceae bacterium]
CLVVAVLAGSVFLVGEYQAHQAQLDLSPGPAAQADRLLPPWSRTASLLAQAWTFHGITNHHNQSDYERSRAWRVDAVHRDNTDPALWIDLAQYDATIGRDPKAAETEFMMAVRLNPTSALAMTGLAHLAGDRCDIARQKYWQQRADQVSPPLAAPPVPSGLVHQPPATPTCAGPAPG